MSSISNHNKMIKMLALVPALVYADDVVTGDGFDAVGQFLKKYEGIDDLLDRELADPKLQEQLKDPKYRREVGEQLEDYLRRQDQGWDNERVDPEEREYAAQKDTFGKPSWWNGMFGAGDTTRHDFKSKMSNGSLDGSHGDEQDVPRRARGR